MEAGRQRRVRAGRQGARHVSERGPLAQHRRTIPLQRPGPGQPDDRPVRRRQSVGPRSALPGYRGARRRLWRHSPAFVASDQRHHRGQSRPGCRTGQHLHHRPGAEPARLERSDGHHRLLQHQDRRSDQRAQPDRYSGRLLFAGAQSQPDAKRLLQPDRSQSADGRAQRFGRDAGGDPDELEPGNAGNGGRRFFCRLSPHVGGLLAGRAGRFQGVGQRDLAGLLPHPSDAQFHQPYLLGLLQHRVRQSSARVEMECAGCLYA
ncbi:hypothetical protein D3C72_595570 [compost metagenome]